jgi:putative spermidine/putrescine transport system substrate-binding protein
MRCLRFFQLSIVGCAVLASLIAAHAQAPAKLRGPAEATVDNPLTRADVEALLQKFRGQSLTFSSWGGALQAAQRQAYLEPFEKQFGVKFVEDTNPLQPKIQAMVEAKNVTIDVVDLGLRQSSDLATRNALEALDFRIIDRRRTPDIWRSEWSGGGGAVWATVLAYRDGVRKPTSWADFWDVKGFPGRRGFSQFLAGHLEFPLLAAGILPKDIKFPLTPAQEQIAFDKLKELAPSVTLFWNSGSAPPELLIKGEVDYTTAWNGRIFDAQKQGAPIKVCWECGFVVGIDSFSIPKGSPKKDLAQLFIAWTAFSENNVRLSQVSSYGPTDQEAVKMLSKLVDRTALRELPGSEANRQWAVFEDGRWVGQNTERLNPPYQALFQKR